jgi:riboflavin synthase
MFTGIVRKMGRVVRRRAGRLEIEGAPAKISIGDSVAVNGACLTVVSSKGRVMGFDVSEETFRRTDLGGLKPGDGVNLETAARVGDTLGGHIVLGHIDGTGAIASRKSEETSVLYEFSFPPELKKYLAVKGSVSVDGVSLTVVEIRRRSFTVAVIPHTEKNTTLGAKRIGDRVNLEADILAKHVETLLKGWAKP